ncbi:MAG: hypothetical protein K2P78_14575 [Gemmataceae bacterium]|nr:hypothetical protein [Gemmataceae bacterium]
MTWLEWTGWGLMLAVNTGLFVRLNAAYRRVSQDAAEARHALSTCRAYRADCAKLHERTQDAAREAADAAFRLQTVTTDPLPADDGGEWNEDFGQPDLGEPVA